MILNVAFAVSMDAIGLRDSTTSSRASRAPAYARTSGCRRKPDDLTTSIAQIGA
jgi:hypothetical protein